jgi:hypothetical protein
MRKERIKAKMTDLIMNEGQLGWLPTNPRQWTQKDIDLTKASLQNDPDFTEERPVLVVECDGKLLVFAGNLRTTAARALKWEYISAVLYTPENDEDKDTIKRRSILDNGSFGSWDYDMLANEWDDLPLSDWGVDGIPTEANVSATELLSSLEYDPLYYEPKNKPDIKLSDCYDLTKFNAKVAALDEYDLTPAQKEVMKMFCYRFIKIDFESVANYYAFNATDEEQKVIERLRLVLADSGGVDGFIEDDLLRIMNISKDWGEDEDDE